METTHTPGPWTSGTSNYRKAIFAPDSRGAIPIAYVGNNGQDHEVEISNAKLIAAAPELLAALRGIVTQCQPPALQAEGIRRTPTQQQIDSALAALAKAEGK